LTVGGLGRHILRLSVPATAEQGLFSATDLVNLFLLGMVGGTAQAGVAMATTLRIVLISPMMGLSVGGMAIVARHIGAQERRQADHAVMQTILLILLFIAPISVLGEVLGNVFLGWLGAKDALLADALTYLRVIFWGLFFMECLPTLNGVIRAAGHPEQTLLINTCRSLTLVILGPLLIPRLGVLGAGWTDVLSNAVGVAAQVVVLLRGSAGLRLHWRDVRPDFPMMGRILKVAMPTSAQRFAPNLTSALLMRLVSSFGNPVLTAYTVVTRVMGFLQGPAMGISTATSTLVGQNLGARKPERAERAAMLSLYAALACSFLILGALCLWPAPVLGLFNRSADVLPIAVVTVRYMLLAGVATAWSTVMVAALCGAGDTLSTMWIGVGSLIAQLSLSWALAQGLNLGPIGIWLGLGSGQFLGALAMTVRLRQGHWRNIVI
jgi:putative MATE family efflux protein